MWTSLQKWARAIKRDTLAVYLAARDRRTPWYARAIAAIVVAYALSPIDLIPDFIPVLGYLDDLVLVPLGMWMTMRLVPNDVMEDCRVRAEAMAERPVSMIAAFAIVCIWLAAAALFAWLAYQAVRGE